MGGSLCAQKTSQHTGKSSNGIFTGGKATWSVITLWFQSKDMFQLIVMPQGIEKVTIQLKDTLTKVYAMGAVLIFIKGAPRSA